MPKQFNLYDYINHYGTRMVAIAATDAMPKNYWSILFTGTMEECQFRLNPPGLEGTIEDHQRKIKVAS